MTKATDNKPELRSDGKARPQEKGGMETETKILQAAEREFMAKGFAGARTTAIAEAAGVTHAMFHYYFRTKEKLFDRILSEKVNLLKEALIDSLVDANLTLDEMIHNIIDRHLDFISSNPDLPRFIIGEIYSDPERCASFIQKLQTYAPTMTNGLQAIIDAAATEGRCRKVDAKMLMLDIASLNIFSYMAAPIVNAALGNCMSDGTAFLEMRKKDNYDTIMRKLRP